MLYSVTEHAFDLKSHLIPHTVTSETHEERNIRSEKSSASVEEDDLKKRPFANRSDSASKCETKSGINQKKQEKQVIPGLGAYSDSSDSDSSSDES